ncbi:MAG: zinc ribbon domain-containing protein [Eubacterium sp.]|nr:zinc ribbon domain-containing protein [Eubacterium sp.]
MKCKKCGTELRSDDEFCYRCGQRTTVFQRLFASRAIVGSTIAIVIVAAAAVLTWMIVSGRLDLSSLGKRNADKPGTENVTAGGNTPREDKGAGDQQPAATAEPVSEPTSEPEPTPEPTPEITYPVDVTKDMKTEMKELSTRIRPFLAFCASYYERGRHAFKWDDMSASTMALYNLQYLDKTVKYGTPIDTIMKKTKKEVKNLFGKNAKCRFTYSGRFPDYVFVKTGNTMVYNVTRITGKTYSMKTDKVIEYKEGKYRLIVSAGLVSERNKKDKGYFQKYTVYVEKDESAKYGFVIRKIALYKKKDGKTA